MGVEHLKDLAMTKGNITTLLQLDSTTHKLQRVLMTYPAGSDLSKGCAQANLGWAWSI